MPWSDLAGHAAVMVAALVLAGLTGLALAPALGRRPPRLDSAVLAGAALAAMAAPELALPLTPVPPGERNLLVALAALSAATWVGARLTGAGPREREAVVVGLGAFALAVALTVVAPGTLRPQAVGSIVFGAEAPVKVACAALALLALPAATGALGDRRQPGRPQLSAALAFPYAALVVSQLTPPPDDLAGAVRWLLATAAVIAVTAGLARYAGSDDGRVRRLHRRLIPAATVVAAATTFLVTVI